jgi:hypothetical protein
MRALLEFLGIVEPRTERREPVALPAWGRWLAPIVTGALTAASFLLYALVRSIVG